MTLGTQREDVRIGDTRRDWDRGRDWEHRRFGVGVRGEFRGCKTVVTRERRGDAVVMKRIKRCD